MLPTITLLSPSSLVFKNDAQFILEVLYRLRIFDALSCRIKMLLQRTKYSCEVSFASSQLSVQITHSSYRDIDMGTISAPPICGKNSLTQQSIFVCHMYESKTNSGTMILGGLITSSSYWEHSIMAKLRKS